METFRTLRLGPNFQLIFTQALQELEIESQQRDKFLVRSRECYDNTQNSSGIYGMVQRVKNNYWVTYDGDVCILDCTYPKKHCHMMQGASNAGKTFWTDTIMSIPDLVGQTIQSTDFAFQNCIGNQIISIPELTFSKMEKWKKRRRYLAGLPTVVNVKNKEQVRLPRTPVFLTCNQVPWKAFDQESRPLHNRMFLHKDLIKSTVLPAKTDGLVPDPRFYQKVLTFIRSDVIGKMEWPPTVDDLDWYLAVDMVSDFISDKINTGMDTLKSLVTMAGIDGALEDRYYKDGMCSSGRIRDIDVGFYGFEEISKQMLPRLLAWLWMLQKEDSSDYYWDFTDFKRPKLICSMTHEQYDPHTDMDEMDYSSMKDGMLFSAGFS